MKYPVKPDLPDHRDIPYTLTPAPQPDHISWRSHYPQVWNQGDIGSCTAQAMSAAVAYFTPSVDPSRMFQYYNERKIDGDVSSDTGSTIRTACKAASSYGICDEPLWPYINSHLFLQPPETCYQNAVKDTLSTYYRIAPNDGPDTVSAIRNAVAIGQPVVIGIVAFEGLESSEAAQTGVVPMPVVSQAPLGGHAVVLTGYSNETQLFQFRNSWGEGWGDKGYGYFPYAYFDQYLMSSWVVTGAKG